MFNFFKKNDSIDVKIHVYSKYYAENVSEIFHKTKYPTWTKSIKTKSKDEMVRSIFNGGSPGNTIKQCPAFIDIISNSFTLCSPCDIVIEIDKLTKNWKAYSRWSKVALSEHDLMSQMGPDNPLSNKGIHIKIENPFMISSSQNMDLVFVQPMYHGLSDFMILPGVVRTNKKMPLDLNVNMFIPNENINSNSHDEKKSIFIKKGDVLAYLYYGKNITINKIESEYLHPDEWRDKFCIVSDYKKLAPNE